MLADLTVSIGQNGRTCWYQVYGSEPGKSAKWSEWRCGRLLAWSVDTSFVETVAKIYPCAIIEAEDGHVVVTPAKRVSFRPVN